MVRIQIILFIPRECYRIFHYRTHIEARIIDVSEPDAEKVRAAHINFGDTNSIAMYELYSDEILNDYDDSARTTQVVNLYSNRNFDDFLEKFYHTKFSNQKNYNYVYRNCADAIKFTLDFFFPTKALNAFYSSYQAACCWLYLGIHGIRYFPVPPAINSPTDVMNRAKLLAREYGAPTKRAEEKAPAGEEQLCAQAIDNDHALLMAVENKNHLVIQHFLQHHIQQFSPQKLYEAFEVVVMDESIAFLTQIIGLLPPELIDKAVNRVLQYCPPNVLKLFREHINRFTAEQRRQILLHLIRYERSVPLPVWEEIWNHFTSQELSMVLIDVVDKNHYPNLKVIQILSECKHGADLKFTDKSGESILSTAILKQHYDVVNYFIENCSAAFNLSQLYVGLLYLISQKKYALADLLIVKIEMLNPAAAFLADKTNQVDLYRDYDFVEYFTALAQRLLTLHAQDFIFNHLGTNLKILIKSKQYRLATFLLENRRGIGMATDQDGNYAIHHAVRLSYTNLEFIRLLCESETHTVLTLENRHGETALTLAVNDGNMRVTEYFFEKQGNKFSIQQKFSGLLIAIDKIDGDIANYILKLIHSELTSPQLAKCVCRAIISGKYSFAKTIIDLRPDVCLHKVLSSNNNSGYKDYPIHVAIRQWVPDVDFIKMLSEFGPVLNFENDLSETPLQLAIKKGHREVVRHLVTQHKKHFNPSVLATANTFLIEKKEESKESLSTQLSL